MTNFRETLKADLQRLADRHNDRISLQQGAVVYDSRLETEYPTLNLQRLLTLYGDNPGDWKTIIAEYLATAEEPEAAEPPTPARPPLRCIGRAPDLFTGQLRPIYNREPEPGEARPPIQSPD